MIAVLQKGIKDMIDDNFKISIDEWYFQSILFEYLKVFKFFYFTQAVRLKVYTLVVWIPSENIGIILDLHKIYPILFEGESSVIKNVLL